MTEEPKVPKPQETPAPAGSAAGEPSRLPADDPIRRFLDIPIRVSVRLDRRRIWVREILGLQEDSILRLHRSAGENVDLLLGGVRAGSGEIVVIEDSMGLRITDLGGGSQERKA